jgi:hypothetical protein
MGFDGKDKHEDDTTELGDNHCHIAVSVGALKPL